MQRRLWARGHAAAGGGDARPTAWCFPTSGNRSVLTPGPARSGARRGGHRLRPARPRRLPREQRACAGSRCRARATPAMTPRPSARAMRSAGTAFTNASQVYADACAEHVAGHDARPGPPAPSVLCRPAGRPRLALRRDGATRSRLLTRPDGGPARLWLDRPAPRASSWPRSRARSTRSAAQLRSEPGVHVVSEDDLTKVLAEADHVVNVLPENDATQNYVNARRIACFKPRRPLLQHRPGGHGRPGRAHRGPQSGSVGAAYLDVTAPEPLPPDPSAVVGAQLLHHAPHGGRPQRREPRARSPFPCKSRRLREGRADDRPDPVTISDEPDCGRPFDLYFAGIRGIIRRVVPHIPDRAGRHGAGCPTVS